MSSTDTAVRKVYVTDDNGTKHLGTIVGKTNVFGPFSRYTIVIDETGQELQLFAHLFEFAS